MAPIVPPKYLSVTGAHDWPALIDLQTPPPVVPIQNSFSRDGFPATATERPPRNGPTSRQRSPVKVSESRWANAGTAARESSKATDALVDRAEMGTETSRWDRISTTSARWPSRKESRGGTGFNWSRLDGRPSGVENR